MSISRLRQEIESLKAQKLHHFADFERVINRIRNEFGYVFPRNTVNKNGSKFVYEFGLRDVFPISLEKEHGSRDCIPTKYAKRAIMSLDDLLSYIEVHAKPEDERDPDNFD